MSTPTQVTGEQRVAKVFGLTGDNWSRHASPVSVITRFAVLPLLAISIWSRDWIGWWSLVPIVASLIFMMVNPLLFPKPRSTRNWASKGVFGERVWSERLKVPVPAQFNAKVFTVTYAIQLAGAAALTYGLVRYDLLVTLTGLIILQTAKAWYIDRQVLLYEDMKTRHPEYASWEY
ncbi:hypothetical protein OHA21_19790 [Actinoplanes sp. NBC_00393]|uniref:DUF6653 family protein n=1 Tax=Actinoplanes sp. NBC_00393 TaxID=2975953 RepID=UPI002E24F822